MMADLAKLEKGRDKSHQASLTKTEWDRLRVYGVPLWVKDQEEVKKLGEGLSRQLVMRIKSTADQNEVRAVADLCSLLFAVLKKTKALQVVYKTILNDKKLAEFLAQDFSTEKAKEVAKKNAFRLSAIHRSHLSSAFFCIAGEPWLGIDAIVKDLKDVRLGFFMARLWDGPDGPIFTRFLKEIFLPSAKDNCEAMMAKWWLHQEEDALVSLVHSDERGPGSPSSRPESNEEAGMVPGSFGKEDYVPAAAALFDALSPRSSGTMEKANLAHASAYAYAASGCPILALQRCQHLLPGFNPAANE